MSFSFTCLLLVPGSFFPTPDSWFHSLLGTEWWKDEADELLNDRYLYRVRAGEEVGAVCVAI